MKKIFYTLGQVFILSLVLFLCSELYLAHKGVTLEWQQNRQKFFQDQIPGNLLNAVKRCGWGYEKNSHTHSVEDYNALINTGKDGLRVSRPELDKKGKHHTAFFGCSYTFGEGINDEETMVYKLNDKYPNEVFDNYGVSGYGTVQSLIVMQDVLEQNKYDLIVYCATRPQFARNIEKRVVGDLHINRTYCIAPRVKFYSNGSYKISDNSALLWPGQNHFLTIDWLHRVYFGMTYDLAILSDEKTISTEHWQKRLEAMSKLIKLMQEACFKKKVRFLVVSTSDMKDGALKDVQLDKAIEYINIDHPQSMEANYRVKNIGTNHPNGKVHAYWAEQFSQWYDKNILQLEKKLN